MIFAKVMVNLSLDKTFDYIIPESIAADVLPGVQVELPFGGSFRRGYVAAIANESEYPVSKLKSIIGVCYKHPRVPDSLMKLGDWIADYYCCSREQAMRSLLPGAVRSGKIKHKTVSLYAVADTAAAQDFLIKKGNRSKSQAAVLKLLSEKIMMKKEQITAGIGGGGKTAIKELLKAGLIKEEKRIVSRDPYEDVEILPSFPKTPNPEQADALNLIYSMIEDKVPRNTVLLYGVTGSGKTEVYLQSIEKALALELESIVLVPEISLTPQTVSRFRARFGNKVCVMHSMLSDGERYDAWMKIYNGEVKIVVGARSALFAPFRRLGLIIVDEEHENSYKQSEAPRYHARDVAVMRGRMENAVVILGSATPSFESFTNVSKGKYRMAELKTRVDNCMMPDVKVVDLRLDASEKGMTGSFSKVLINAVYQRLNGGEQTILFLNKRGYARQMICDECGYVAQCPDCSVPYTYHKKMASLSCHLCGSVIAAPVKCPSCGNPEVRYSGSGTERIESVAEKLFPSARIVRMDSDTMKNSEDYEDVFDRFHKGEIDILIGTQMIAKGLHFPNVTLVGILNADLSLYIPDFRAEERTFQLLTQVAGRAGRGDIHGEVIIQTMSPNNPAINCASSHDFKKFYEEEMDMRREFNYPPESHLTTVHFGGEDSANVMKFAEKFAEELKKYIIGDIIISPPAPAPIERIKRKFRYMIILRGRNLKPLRDFLRYFVLHSKRPKDVEMYVDVDALSLL